MASNVDASRDARGSAAHAGASGAAADSEADILTFQLGQLSLAPQPPMGQMWAGKLYCCATGGVAANVIVQGQLAAGAGQMLAVNLPRADCWFVPAGAPPLDSDPLRSTTRATAILRQCSPPHAPAGQLLFATLPVTQFVTLQFMTGVAVMQCRF